MPTLQLHSNVLLYSNTVIGTLAIDGWAVTFGTARRGLGGWGLAQYPPHCTKGPVYQLHIILPLESKGLKQSCTVEQVR